MSLTSGLEHIVRENEPLAAYTSLRIGGVAEYFAEPTSVAELCELAKRFTAAELPIRLLGGGSNLLVRNEGVPGLVISLSSPTFTQIQVEGDRLRVGGGTQLSHLIATAAREGLAGPQHLAGIPGTVGGALHQNSGHSGFDIGSWLVQAKAVTRLGDLVTRDLDALSFSYRTSSLNELAIIEATFQFEREPAESLTRQLQKNWIIKRAQQPGISEASAYMFKDYGGQSAAELICRAGLQGTQVGKVEIFDRNENFFIAHPGATSADVLRLIELVKNQVLDRLGIELSLGLQIW